MLTVNQINELKTKIENLKDVLNNVRGEIDELSGELYEVSQIEDPEITEVMEEADIDLDEFFSMLETVKEMSEHFPTWSCISSLEDRCESAIDELDQFADFVDSYEDTQDEE